MNLKPQTALSAEANFEENTWTFEMIEPYKVAAGLFKIVPGSLYEEMIAVLSTANQQNMSPDLIELLKL